MPSMRGIFQRQDIGPMLGNHLASNVVGRGADNGDVGITVQLFAEHTANNRGIVNDQNAYGHALQFSCFGADTQNSDAGCKIEVHAA